MYFGDVTTFAGKPVPAGGCDAEAERKLNGGSAPLALPGIDPSVPPQNAIHWLEERAAGQAIASIRFRDVLRQWSDCMRSHGYGYSSPDEAQSDPKWSERQNASTVTREEAAVAVADRACREQANLSGVLRHIVAEEERKIIRSLQNTVERAATLLKTRARNAAAILGTTVVY